MNVNRKSMLAARRIAVGLSGWLGQSLRKRAAEYSAL
jgi:hypothetical protein